MDLGIAGTAALVTGSSAGLGKATARTLADEGVDVAVNGRSDGPLEETESELDEDCTGEVVGIQADITDKEETENLVASTVEQFGRLDHLVISGGGPPPRELLDTTDEEFYEAFDLLVMSAARLMRESATHLRKDGGGSIVINASTGVKEPIDWHVLTSGVRIGAVGMGKSVSKELAPEVRVNSILPGPHETDRFHSLFEDLVEKDRFPSKEAALDGLREGIPVDRIGKPEEFAATVAFLCSEKAGYISGLAIPHDGGAGSSLY
jgi:NAD(P)-dependent dehydrogenase (short-subunit alcohol dehydrogenase family)